jgi:HEAT repeat protein
LIILQDSPEAPQRQWAVEMLAAADWSGHPEVAPAVAAAARQDDTPAARVQAIRCLVKKKVNTPQVLDALKGLQADTDLQVRQEAAGALMQLGAGPPPGR